MQKLSTKDLLSLDVYSQKREKIRKANPLVDDLCKRIDVQFDLFDQLASR